MALAYPKSRFFGFDNHAPSINRAHRSAHEAGVADRVVFEIAGATTFPARATYDLIAFFDCLHDFGDPICAAKRAHETLAPDGTVLIGMQSNSTGMPAGPSTVQWELPLPVRSTFRTWRMKRGNCSNRLHRS